MKVAPAVIAASMALAAHCYAVQPREIGWNDLIPRAAGIENPFSRLTRDQRVKLLDIAAFQERKSRGEAVSAVDIADAEAATKSLEQVGLNVSSLLEIRKQLMDQRRLVSQSVNAQLNGTYVRMPGYMLPLEFTGKQIKEFLLVPWVGACVHTPPPPRNQIVHITSKDPVQWTGLFVPVWVSGEMTVTTVRKSVGFIDGASDIDIGYSMRATVVDIFKTAEDHDPTR